MKLTPDSKFMQLCGKFVALFKINFLWLLCSVPLVTLGASTCSHAHRSDGSAPGGGLRGKGLLWEPSAGISARPRCCGC